MDYIAKIKKVFLDKDISREYAFVAFFGSAIRLENYSDIDIISIGGDNVHSLAKARIKKLLAQEGAKVSFFKTVKKKPILIGEVLIHDLHFKDFHDFYKKE